MYDDISLPKKKINITTIWTELNHYTLHHNYTVYNKIKLSHLNYFLLPYKILHSCVLHIFSYIKELAFYEYNELFGPKHVKRKSNYNFV
jgi:hypothetical protein